MNSKKVLFAIFAIVAILGFVTALETMSYGTDPRTDCFLKTQVERKVHGYMPVKVIVSDYATGKPVDGVVVWISPGPAENVTTHEAPGWREDGVAVARAYGDKVWIEPCSSELALGWVRAHNTPWETRLDHDIVLTLHLFWNNTDHTTAITIHKEESSDPMFSARMYGYVAIVVIDDSRIVSVANQYDAGWQV